MVQVHTLSIVRRSLTSLEVCVTKVLQNQGMVGFTTLNCKCNVIIILRYCNALHHCITDKCNVIVEKVSLVLLLLLSELSRSITYYYI